MTPDEWDSLLQECKDTNILTSNRARSRLYRLYSNEVYRYFLVCSRNEALADDLTLETFRRIMKALPDFVGPQTAFKRFLKKVRRNVWLSGCKNLPPDGSDEELDQEPDPSGSPEETLMESDQKRRVRLAMDAVMEPYRTPLILRDLEGCPYEEISKILGVPVGTVNSRLARGRELFKTEYFRLLRQEEVLFQSVKDAANDTLSSP